MCTVYIDIHCIHNGTKTTKLRLGILFLLSFACLHLSKKFLGCHFQSEQQNDVEFEDCIAFAILQFYIRTLRTYMTIQALIQEKIFTEAFLFWPSDLPLCKF